MLQKTKKRKSVEMFPYQALKDIVKVGGENVVKNFGEKFRELKIEGSKRKTIEDLFMGTESGVRTNLQDRHGDS